MSFFPNIANEMEPRWLMKRWDSAKKTTTGASDAEAEQVMENRIDATVRLGGHRGRTTRVACTECGLSYLAGRGHRDSAYCWRVRVITWAYANTLFPLTSQARDTLVAAQCRFEWLPTAPVETALSMGDSSYMKTGRLSHKLWVEHDVAALIYGTSTIGATANKLTWSAITSRLKAGERGDPLKISRLWNADVALAFASLKPVRPEVPERLLYTEIRGNTPVRRPGLW